MSEKAAVVFGRVLSTTSYCLCFISRQRGKGVGSGEGGELAKSGVPMFMRTFLMCLYLFLWDGPMSREGNEVSFQLSMTEWCWLPGWLC